MPAFDPQTLSRSSSALFFQLGATAFSKHRHDPSAVDGAIDARLDHYIAGDRAVALDHAKRIFKRCATHHGDPLTGSAVWFGTVRCLQRRVPDFALACELEILHQALNFDEGLLKAPEPGGPTVHGLNAELFERYVSAPMLGFLRGLDVRSVCALGLCQTFSANEITFLHQLWGHPAFQSAARLARHLDPEFFVALLESDADEASGSGSATDGDAASEVDVASPSDTTVAFDPRQSTLEAILSALGLEEAVHRMLAAMMATPSPACPLPASLATSFDALAKEYVAQVAAEHIGTCADSDLDGLLVLVRDPMYARTAFDPSALMAQVLAAVGDILAEGLQARSRKRVRDDATGCTQDVS